MANEIITEFVDDAREHLQAASRHLLALEKNPGHKEELNGLLRRLHTIKGNSGFLDMRHLYALLHNAENVLQTVREQSLTVNVHGLTDVLLQVLDTVETMLSQLENNQDDRVPWLDQLMSALDGIDKALSTQTPEETSAAEPKTLATTPTVSKISQAASPSRPLIEKIPPGPRSLTDTGLARTSGSEQVINETTRPDSDPRLGLKMQIQALLGVLGASPSLDQDQTVARRITDHLEHIGAAIRAKGLPHQNQALEIIKNYLAEKNWSSEAPRRTSKELLTELVVNLQAWVEVERPTEAAVVIITVEPDTLEGEASAFMNRIRESFQPGATGLALDLRQIHNLHSAQVGLLVSVLKTAPDPKKVGLILDPVSQPGLARVIKVLSLDQMFRLFFNENDALSKLA